MTGKKQFINVKCKDCEKEYLKRKDTLLSWNNLCAKCSLITVNKLPKMKEVHRKLGLAFIAKFGKLATPKMENRGRGKTHYNWRGYGARVLHGVVTREAILSKPTEQLGFQHN